MFSIQDVHTIADHLIISHSEIRCVLSGKNVNSIVYTSASIIKRKLIHN